LKELNCDKNVKRIRTFFWLYSTLQNKVIEEIIFRTLEYLVLVRHVGVSLVGIKISTRNKAENEINIPKPLLRCRKKTVGHAGEYWYWLIFIFGKAGMNCRVNGVSLPCLALPCRCSFWFLEQVRKLPFLEKKIGEATVKSDTLLFWWIV